MINKCLSIFVILCTVSFAYAEDIVSSNKRRVHCVNQLSGQPYEIFINDDNIFEIYTKAGKDPKTEKEIPSLLFAKWLPIDQSSSNGLIFALIEEGITKPGSRVKAIRLEPMSEENGAFVVRYYKSDASIVDEKHRCTFEGSHEKAYKVFQGAKSRLDRIK